MNAKQKLNAANLRRIRYLNGKGIVSDEKVLRINISVHWRTENTPTNQQYK